MSCLNNPISIPQGTDGNSVTIAFASDSSGSAFSYTPDASRPYIAFVSKTGTVATTDFVNWVKYIGTDGTAGTDGTSVLNVSVSDGTTSIGGTVYNTNVVVVQLSDGTYVNAGTITVPTPTWTALTLVNSWTSPDGYTAEYTITNGFLYFRGRLTNTAATSAIFANLTMNLTYEINVTISDADETTPVFSKFIAAQASSSLLGTTPNTLNIVEYSNGNGSWQLDSIAPISIR